MTKKGKARSARPGSDEAPNVRQEEMSLSPTLEPITKQLLFARVVLSRLPCGCRTWLKSRLCPAHGPAILAAEAPDPDHQAKVDAFLAQARRSGNRYLPIATMCCGCGRLMISKLRSDRWRVRQWPVTVTWADVDAEAERELTMKYGAAATLPA